MQDSRDPEKAVVLLSGGLDSATVMAIAKEEGYELYAITFDYRQRHARELESARSVAAALAVKKHLVIDFSLRDIGGSALTSEMKVPKRGISSPGTDGREQRRPGPGPQPIIPVTYVPARNTIFLSFALAWAEVLETGDIFIGANSVDYSGYPDCRPEYLRAFERMANLATRASVEGSLHLNIRAPLLAMTKAEIIKKGVALGLDYSLTWSCYDPQPATAQRTEGSRRRRIDDHADVMPCGKCDSCRLRRKGFREAGIKDPLISRR